MAAIAREQLHILELPPSDAEIGAFIVLWAVDGEEGRFRLAEVVTHVPRLQEYLRLSKAEDRELHFCMGKSCCPVYPVVYTNEYA
jgi:hypothetical protein